MLNDPQPGTRTLIEGVPHWSWPDGTTLPVVSGGADDKGGTGSADDKGGTGGDGTKPDDKSGESGDDEQKLGPAGEKALAEERKAHREAEKRAKAAETELEKLRSESATEQEKAIAAAKAEGRTEALTVANKRLLKAEITAVASGKLADPSDAAALLDLDDFEVDEHGDVDKQAISKAIEELVKAKPHLAARGGRPAGDGGGGPRGKPAEGERTMDDWLRTQAKAAR